MGDFVGYLSLFGAPGHHRHFCASPVSFHQAYQQPTVLCAEKSTGKQLESIRVDSKHQDNSVVALHTQVRSGAAVALNSCCQQHSSSTRTLRERVISLTACLARANLT